MIEAALLIAAVLGGQADADPLAPARAGKLRCVQPDVAARTCATIVRYTVRDDGGFDAAISGVVNLAPLVVIDYKTSGTIEDGAVCSVVRPADFNAGRLTKDSAPATAAVEAMVRPRIMAALQPLAGKKRCYRDKPEGNVLISDVTVNGVYTADLRQRAIWVSPEDGYRTGM